MCSNQPFSSVLNRVITIQNRRDRLITAHVPWTSSNTRSKTRGARSQMESKEALECHQEHMIKGAGNFNAVTIYTAKFNFQKWVRLA